MDEIDDLLTPKRLPAEPPDLRVTIEHAAAGVQRRRRWLIRGRKMAILAACFLAGAATMKYWLASESPQPIMVERSPTPEPEETPPPADPYRNDPPERLEKWAFVQSGGKRADLYRRAGDGYLLREDVENAVRCYRRALDTGSAADLVIRADRDTWLLMSLKVARQKERSDARVD
jgi:hypothetical protein